MKDYIIPQNEAVESLPTYTNANFQWRQFLLDRWEAKNFSNILTAAETSTDQKWQMPLWASRILTILANERCGGVVPNWMDAVIAISNGEIANLQEINWRQVTDGWQCDTIANIIDCNPDDNLAIAVLQCAILEIKLEAKDNIIYPQAMVIYHPFVRYCNKQIERLENRGEFDLAAIKQTDTARLDYVEEPLGAVENDEASRTTQIPAKLSSEDAQAILKLAVEAGLCKQEQDGKYRWLKSNQLLAYFAVRASDYLELTNRQYNGNFVTIWQPFALLFGVEAQKLRRAKQDYQKGSNDKPKGYEAVDALFDKL